MLRRQDGSPPPGNHLAQEDRQQRRQHRHAGIGHKEQEIDPRIRCSIACTCLPASNITRPAFLAATRQAGWRVYRTSRARPQQGPSSTRFLGNASRAFPSPTFPTMHTRSGSDPASAGAAGPSCIRDRPARRSRARGHSSPGKLKQGLKVFRQAPIPVMGHGRHVRRAAPGGTAGQRQTSRAAPGCPCQRSTSPPPSAQSPLF